MLLNNELVHLQSDRLGTKSILVIKTPQLLFKVMLLMHYQSYSVDGKDSYIKRILVNTFPSTLTALSEIYFVYTAEICNNVSSSKIYY